jgi:hypothetical protein
MISYSIRQYQSTTIPLIKQDENKHENDKINLLEIP